MVFPFRDGRGVLPDSWREVFGYVLVIFFVGGVMVFTGVDAQIEYALTSSQYYFSFGGSPSNGVVFDRSEIDLMNDVSRRSLGSDAVAAERLYCGEIRSGTVFNFRLADTIESSSLDSVSGSCVGPVGIWVHSQPDGSSKLSQEDKDLESTGAEYTCIQFEEITASPVSGRLDGINCWSIEAGGDVFEPVPVYLE